MIITRPKNKTEPCLLSNNEHKDLYLYDLQGELVVRQNAPIDGWNYDSLEIIADSITSNEHDLTCGWEAYLGDKQLGNWIGSSET